MNTTLILLLLTALGILFAVRRRDNRKEPAATAEPKPRRRRAVRSYDAELDALMRDVRATQPRPHRALHTLRDQEAA